MDPNYDPAERRERYLRTRELKGREKGSSEPVGTGRASTATAPPAQNRQVARAAAAQQIKALNAKLTQLRAELAKRRQSSTSKPSSKEGTAEAKSKDKAYNEKYYEEHKSQIKAAAKKNSGGSSTSSSSSSTSSRTVEELESAIRNVAQQLKAAIARLKSL